MAIPPFAGNEAMRAFPDGLGCAQAVEVPAMAFYGADRVLGDQARFSE